MADKDSSKTYKPARQARGRRTEIKFLAAAEKLFASNGFAGSRVADIIAESGCSTGSFYHRFADKRDLFNVMLENVWRTGFETTQGLDVSRATHGSVEQLLSEYADFLFDTVIRNVGFYRAAYEISAQDPAVWEKLKELTVLVGDRFAEVADEYADEISAQDKAQALLYAVQVMITLAIHTTLGSGPLFPADKSELKRIVVKTALGVIR